MRSVKVCPVCSRDYGSSSTHCLEDGVALVALSSGIGARAEALVGQTVDGRYKIERIIGRGGMGTVYACRHVVVGKAAAMKVLKSGMDRSESVLQRFIREAQTANAVRSRHIVEVSDFGQLESGSFYVVMDLLEGESFASALRSGRLTMPELLRVFIQVADGLYAAHAVGVVHRDLKPDNVFLVSDGGQPDFVKLLDFGIAKVIHDEPTSLTETGVILGTPSYMSPEQARAEAVDHRSDIYALGVMMYRAFTGRLPFVADSSIGVITRHLTQEPELPSRIQEIDPALERIILRCLAKSADARYPTMGDVAHALRELVGEAPSRPHTAFGSGSYPTVSAPTSGLASAPTPMPLEPYSPPPGALEMGTTRGVTASAVAAAQRGKSGRSVSALVVTFGLVLTAIVVAVFFAVGGRGAATQVSQPDFPAVFPVATASATAIVTALPLPVASASSPMADVAPVAATTASAKTATARPHSVDPSPRPSVPAAPKRASEIRSPFD
jgi:serine/threonine-protein kinase